KLDEIWTELKADKDDAKFKKYAREQFVPSLAANGGEVPPIHKHFGDKRIEDEAFSLQEGEISKILDMSDKTWVILKCDGHVKAVTDQRLDDERARLYKAVTERN